jgi:hypothetical protein
MAQTAKETTTKDPKKKRGVIAAIWESMTKTGGCCGSGENCCGSSQPGSEKPKDVKKDQGGKTCCN